MYFQYVHVIILAFYHQVFDEDEFETWVLVVLIVGIVALVYILIVPLIWEIAATCRQVSHTISYTKKEKEKKYRLIKSGLHYTIIIAYSH